MTPARALRAAALVCLAVVLTTAAGRRDPFSITFHVQGEEHEGTFAQADPMAKGLYFRVNPSLTHNQMTAFYPFLSEDGQTYGAVFTLNSAGSNRLQQVIAQDPGRLMRVIVNGQPIDYLRIERTEDLGEIVIWRGLNEEYFKLFEKRLKRGSL